MMDFEARKAEIFRRSDERIKIRKRNRKRILLSCMTLVLFVSVISAVSVTSLTKLSLSEQNWSSSRLEYASFFIEITDTHTGSCKIIDDTERAYAAAEILTQYTPDGMPTESHSYGSSAEDKIQESKDTVYEIAFGNESESKVLFTLSGNTLISVDTQTEYQLTDTELEELLTALGLAD